MAPEFSERPLIRWITIDRLAERRLELKPCRFIACQNALDVSTSRADAPQPLKDLGCACRPLCAVG
jgi:hypothetical protein